MLLVIVAAIESVLTSGIVFGWAPLQLLLQEEGIYGDSCPDGPPCEEQAVRLDLIYTAATSAFCFCVWPTGLVKFLCTRTFKTRKRRFCLYIHMLEETDGDPETRRYR